MRKYKILIDGDEVGLISAGESIEVVVPDGASCIQCKVDWCTSNVVSCAEAVEEGCLTVQNAKPKSFWVRLIPLGNVTIGRRSYLALEIGQ